MDDLHIEAPPAAGVPNGGSTGQVLTKNSNTNQDIKWSDPSGGSSASSFYLNEGNQQRFDGSPITLAWDTAPISYGTEIDVSTTVPFTTAFIAASGITSTNFSGGNSSHITAQVDGYPSVIFDLNANYVDFNGVVDALNGQVVDFGIWSHSAGVLTLTSQFSGPASQVNITAVVNDGTSTTHLATADVEGAGASKLHFTIAGVYVATVRAQLNPVSGPEVIRVVGNATGSSGIENVFDDPRFFLPDATGQTTYATKTFIFTAAIDDKFTFDVYVESSDSVFAIIDVKIARLGDIPS